MSSATNVQHADPSGNCLPEHHATPAQQGQRPIVKGANSIDTLPPKGVTDSTPLCQRPLPASSTCTITEPESIRAARAIMAGKLLLIGGIEMDIDIEQIDECWSDYMFRPEFQVEVSSEPGSRTLLARGHGFGIPEENEVWRATLDLTSQGRELARRLYAMAAAEAVETLADLANERRGIGYKSTRLRARMCQAARAELHQLVREWDEVQS